MAKLRYYITALGVRYQSRVNIAVNLCASHADAKGYIKHKYEIPKDLEHPENKKEYLW